MSAIELCRTAALGGHVEACDDCAHSRVAYNSCRNSHCPKCQSAARDQWLADREADLLPVPNFHVVFTVPGEIAAIASQNKRLVYGILFEAVAATLKTIAADPRHKLGGELDFIEILHTWGQTLTHPPPHTYIAWFPAVCSPLTVRAGYRASPSSSCRSMSSPSCSAGSSSNGCRPPIVPGSSISSMTWPPT
jgi:hypothetical protein